MNKIEHSIEMACLVLKVANIDINITFSPCMSKPLKLNTSTLHRTSPTHRHCRTGTHQGC